MKSTYGLATRTALLATVFAGPVLFGASSAFAAAPTSTATFLQDAVSSDSAQVEMGQLALEKSGDAAVRKLGQMLIDDHSQAKQQAGTLANSLQVALPVATGSDAEAQVQALRALSGGSFDQAFVEAVIQTHRETIAKFQQEAMSGDSQVSALAQQALPALESQLRMAEILKMRATEHGTP